MLDDIINCMSTNIKDRELRAFDEQPLREQTGNDITIGDEKMAHAEAVSNPPGLPPLFSDADHRGITAEDATGEKRGNTTPEAPHFTTSNQSQRSENAPTPSTTGQDHHSPNGDPAHFEIRTIPLDQIISFPGEPRRHFDREETRSLAESIKKDGLITPLLVTPLGDKYVLLGGNRRWRALQLLGIDSAQARIVTDGFKADQLNQRNARRLALIDNLQRKDLNPLEGTMAIIDHVQDELGLATPDEAAELLRQATTQQRSDDATRAAAILHELGYQPDSFRSNRLRILNLRAHLREEVLNNRLGYTIALLLNNIEDDAERLQLTEHVITAKLSRDNVQALLLQRHHPDTQPDDARRVRLDRAMTRLTKAFGLAKDKLHANQMNEIEKRITELQLLLKGKSKPKP